MTEDTAPPPVDWRATPITVDCKVLYHHNNGFPKIGVVLDVRRVNREWWLKVRWIEDWNLHHTPGTPRADQLHISAQIRSTSITVWPEVRCVHAQPAGPARTPLPDPRPCHTPPLCCE
jgi:hypothetical protein